MIDGGPLIVTLQRRAGRVRALLDAPPKAALTRLMEGRTATEAARMAGLMGESCPLAHEAAARAAFGLAVEPDCPRAMAAEALRQHLNSIFTRWPAALGLPAGAPPDAAAPPADIALALFGPGGAPDCVDAFEDWLDQAEVAPAAVLRRVWRRWDSRWGRADLRLWRVGEPFADIDWAEAEIDGEPVETGVAARLAREGLLRGIEARRGRGLAWRLAARLVDCRRLLDGLGGRGPLDSAVALSPGIGAAPSASGVILAYGALSRDRVEAFEQLTPTDAALHPRGALRRMLDRVPMRANAPVAAVTAMTLEALDPRVACRIAWADGPARPRRAAPPGPAERR
ncbi:MAG: hypothetical protein ACK4WC_10185, partial [Rubrimonas sp.]